MIPNDSSSQIETSTKHETAPLEQIDNDVTPPIGVTPPQILAQDAAAGRRGAAWRLLYWIMENDPRAVCQFPRWMMIAWHSTFWSLLPRVHGRGNLSWSLRRCALPMPGIASERSFCRERVLIRRALN